MKLRFQTASQSQAAMPFSKFRYGGCEYILPEYRGRLKNSIKLSKPSICIGKTKQEPSPPDRPHTN